MFLRIRWFVMGAAASVGIFTYLANVVRKARDRMTPRNLANSGLRGVANLLDNAADAVKSDGEATR
ncbi:MAG: hypothetical protein GY926_22000 [bacterium]|nr:hypothetical protein [bacterium]MCP4967894.1 hypothetical protein [bacterium]